MHGHPRHIFHWVSAFGTRQWKSMLSQQVSTEDWEWKLQLKKDTLLPWKCIIHTFPTLTLEYRYPPNFSSPVLSFPGRSMVWSFTTRVEYRLRSPKFNFTCGTRKIECYKIKPHHPGKDAGAFMQRVFTANKWCCLSRNSSTESFWVSISPSLFLQQRKAIPYQNKKTNKPGKDVNRYFNTNNTDI